MVRRPQEWLGAEAKLPGGAAEAVPVVSALREPSAQKQQGGVRSGSHRSWRSCAKRVDATSALAVTQGRLRLGFASVTNKPGTSGCTAELLSHSRDAFSPPTPPPRTQAGEAAFSANVQMACTRGATVEDPWWLFRLPPWLLHRPSKAKARLAPGDREPVGGAAGSTLANSPSTSTREKELVVEAIQKVPAELSWKYGPANVVLGLHVFI